MAKNRAECVTQQGDAEQGAAARRDRISAFYAEVIARRLSGLPPGQRVRLLEDMVSRLKEKEK